MMIEKNHIYLGDCIQLMDDIPQQSIDLILCDLPYGVLNKANSSASWDRPLPMDLLWERYRRIIKPAGAIVLFAQGLFTARLMLSNPRWWRYNLVWNKMRTTGFLNANRMPLRCHEDICVFYRSQPVYHPQMQPCTKEEASHSRGTKTTVSNHCYGSFANVGQAYAAQKFPRSILSIPKEHQTGRFLHPTQKPVELMRYLIRTYTDEGHTVLDNCMGSGTSCVAAILENRSYIGMEIQKEYFETAKSRIESLYINP